MNNRIKEIRWRVTAPMRYALTNIKKAIKIVRSLPLIVRKGDGLPATVRKSARIFCREGFAGLKVRLRKFVNQPHPSVIPSLANTAQAKFRMPIVPHYIVDTNLDCTNQIRCNKSSIAVHLHLFYPEMLNEFVSRLRSMPYAFDLYVSVPEQCYSSAILAELQAELPQIGKIVVEAVPNRGRDIAALIIQFGERLVKYDIIAHFHSKKSPHHSGLSSWCKDILDLLIGPPGNSGSRILHIIDLLESKAKFVYPEGQTQIIKDQTGWADNYELAKDLLEKYTRLSIENFPVVDFSEGSMFWARAVCLKDFLQLPLDWTDFSTEPITADGTLAHALERLMLVFASEHEGQVFRIHQGDSLHDYRYYEEQRDCSASIVHSDIKVLAYYLPQFHPVPENDLWHGEGFTEWTKVRAANPLFEGHYQQHIPHPDIDYYLLDSPDTLRSQAEMMRQAGVYGQVFYHYWFSGKLILEEPARMLLEAPDIDMPYCFCWANENWTRRWDGNENEILLGQHYSSDDALAFIQYLIPFFLDPRYIKVDGRPVLFVYRPSSIPAVNEYLTIWEKACAVSGVKRPYVVAVLTRGAANPRDFGMDAGVERVLHDWTAGSVPEIKGSLRTYEKFSGSILPYDEVANFYSGQTESKDFTYFRSLVPTWDNTARYGSEAFLLHGSTPQKFQEWLGEIIAFSKLTLPEDRRFVLVNAWNEWAEGAHLEPDSRYGYSYLNSVGRALSGISYAADFNPNAPVPPGLRIHISHSELALAQLQSDPNLRQRFLHCLSQSTIFNHCTISIDAPELVSDLSRKVHVDHGSEGAPDYILQFRRAALFEPRVIEKMVKTACCSPESVVLSNYCDGYFPVMEVTENGSVDSYVAHQAPLLLSPTKAARHGYRNYKVRSDAHSFVAHPSVMPLNKLPVVTTIIRFHKSADIDTLKNALYCLATMQECVVVPLIATQDLSEEQVAVLDNVLKEFVWADGFEPQVDQYHSADGDGDVRSKMLNESLRQVKTRYAAFLDFDDLLMSHAYDWLITRLKQTGKAVSFGRVYSTAYDEKTGLFLDRKSEFVHGYSYDDFFNLNHAPLHSFMLDLTQLDLSRIVYYDDQRFMEDYFLTLQLFTRENADWASLAKNVYIGDYIHSVNRAQTLAFSDKKEREALYSNPEYMLCEERICALRFKLSVTGNKRTLS